VVEALSGLPFVRPVLSARNRAEVALLRRRLLSGPPVYGVSVHQSLLDARVVADLLGCVDVVMTWPVNTVEHLEQVLAWGANGVISDERDVLAELVSSR
jgi:glycerophosphoryl diester phosphodiesterase